ncbi:MAG: transporter [Thermodesulfobacteriota bacterium]|jgi:hypothetical protein
MFFVSLILGCCFTSLAAIPLITNDTGTQGKGKFQLEFLGEYAHEREEIVNDKGAFSSTLTYGIADPVDIAISIPYQFWRKSDCGLETTGSGLSDLAIELKWRFYEKEGLSLALKPGFTIPTGDDKKDLGAGMMTYYLIFITSKEINSWSFHLNLAYIRNNNTEDDRTDLWHASFASTVEVVKKLKFVADIGVESNPDRSSSNPPAYILGELIWSPKENLDIAWVSRAD